MVFYVICTGVLPYRDYQPELLLGNFIINGGLPNQKLLEENEIPEDFIAIMKKCWRIKNSERPTTRELLVWFTENEAKYNPSAHKEESSEEEKKGESDDVADDDDDKNDPQPLYDPYNPPGGEYEPVRFIGEDYEKAQKEEQGKPDHEKFSEERPRQATPKERLDVSGVNRLILPAKEAMEELGSFKADDFFLENRRLDFCHSIYLNRFLSNFRPKDLKEHRLLTVKDYEELYLPDPAHENIISDPQNDKKLWDLMKEINRDYGEKISYEMKKRTSDISRLKMLLKAVLVRIIAFFKPPENVVDKRKWINKGIRNSQRLRNGNNAYLGDMEGYLGFCRHHSVLVKVICDSLEVKCRLDAIMRFHAWNVVFLKNEFFVVDITNLGFQLTPVEDYTGILFLCDESDVDIRKAINKMYSDKQKEIARVKALQRFVGDTEGNFKKMYHLSKKGKKGGTGDISIYIFDDEVKDDKDNVLFRKNEQVAVKRVTVFHSGNPSEGDDGEEEEEEETEGEGEDEEEESSSDDDEMKRFFDQQNGINKIYAIREANRYKVLDYPSIINTFGYWENVDENGTDNVFIAMEGMDFDGTDFLKKLRTTKESEMSKRAKQIECVIFLLEVARGLRYLQSVKIQHLDLKLGNVMVKWDDEKKIIRNVRIIDFGAAKGNDVRTCTKLMTTFDSDAPEIVRLKEKQEIRVNIQWIQNEVKTRRTRRRKKLSARLIEKINFVKGLLTRTKDVCGVEKHLKWLLKKIPVGDGVGMLSYDWVETMKKKLKSAEEIKMDPERGKSFDHRADIYSYGIMLEEILDSQRIWRKKKKEGEVLPHKEEVSLYVYERLYDMMEKCVEHKREKRPLIYTIIMQLSTIMQDRYFLGDIPADQQDDDEEEVEGESASEEEVEEVVQGQVEQERDESSMVDEEEEGSWFDYCSLL